MSEPLRPLASGDARGAPGQARRRAGPADGRASARRSKLRLSEPSQRQSRAARWRRQRTRASTARMVRASRFAPARHRWRHRFRRSPTTASCRTATPARWSPPTARSSGCACRTSTRRRSSARCSTAARAAGASVPTACTCRPDGATSPGTNMIETTWMTPQGWLRVVDALTIGEWHDNEHGSSHTRPPTDFDADHLLVRDDRMRPGPGAGRDRLRADARLRRHAGATWSTVETGDARARARWTRRRRRRTAFRLFSDIRMGIEGNRAHGRHTMAEGEKRFCALSWTEARGGPHTVEQAEEHLAAHRPLLARLAGRRHLPRPSLALSPAALGARAEGPDVHAHGRARRGADDLAAGDAAAASATGTTATAGCATRRSRCGRCTRSASTGRPTTSSSTSPTCERNEDGSLQIMYGIRGEKDLEESTLDHLKGYEGARPVRIGNGAYNQRQNDVFGAVLDSVYLHSKQRDHIPERLWPVLIDQVRCAATRLAGTRPGHLGGARRAPPLRLLEADVLGRAGPRRAPGRTARRATSRPRSGRRSPTRSARTSSSAASTSAACSASTTTPTRSTRRRC